jgi:hypothetical protein
MDVNAINDGAFAVVQAEVPTMHFMDNPLITPQPPSWVLFDFTIDPNKTFRGASTVDLTFRCIVGRQDPQAGGKSTRGLAGDGVGTPFYALQKPKILGTGNGAQTLNGACDDCVVTLVRGYRLYAYGTVDYLGFELSVMAIGERAS